MPAESSRTFVSWAGARPGSFFTPVETEAWGTWPPGFLGLSVEQPLLEDRRLWGPATNLEILNHQAAYSLLPPHLARNGVALSLSRCGAFSLSSGRGRITPQCCLLWVCMLGGRVKGEGGKGLPTAASHRPGVPSPSPVKWLKKYLSHKRNEARVSKEGSGLLS